MFNVNQSTLANEMFSEVNNVINHQLIKTGEKKFFCSYNPPDPSAAWWEAGLGSGTSWGRGWLESERWMAPQAGPHNVVLTGGVFYSGVWSSGSLIL